MLLSLNARNLEYFTYVLKTHVLKNIEFILNINIIYLYNLTSIEYIIY